jgi:hypothetical protein
VNAWLKTKLLSFHILAAHQFSSIQLLFPNLKILLMGWRFNDIILTQAKSWDSLAKFQTSFTKFFEWGGDHWTTLKETTLRRREILLLKRNSFQRLSDHATYEMYVTTKVPIS